MTPIRIFISSVQKEFASERLRIFEWIQSDALLGQYFVPVLFEKLPAASQKPSEVYLDEVRDSQIYLVILGREYGYEDASGVSPTEREYECAKENNRYKIAFIKGDNTLKRNPKQEKFIAKIQGELTYKRFGTGVNEMMRLSAAEGLKAPEFDFDGGVTITLWRPVQPENNQKTARKPQENHKKTTRKPQEESRETILAMLRINPAISLRDMAQQTGLPYGGLRHHLEKMRAEGLIRREGADKGGRWVVVE